MSVSDLAEAILDLKNRLPRDGFSEELLGNVAEDWAVNRELLRRKFREAAGCGVEAFTVVNFSEFTELQREAAERQARAWYEREIARADTALPICGKFFTDREIPYIAAAWTIEGIWAVDVRSCEMMLFQFPTKEDAYDYVLRWLS